eukprot:scaffold126812_cov27-Tisochrysis_lutea.AAC.1
MPSSRKRARRASQAPKSRLSKVGEAGAPCSSTGAPATDERISATKSLTARRSRASDAPSSLASCSSSSASSSSSPYAESARASTSRGASSSPPLAALSLHWFSTAASASAARAMCATQSAGGECASTDGVPERRCLSSRSAERTVSRHAHAGATSGDEQGDFVRAGAASASHASCWIACCSCCASAPSSAAAAVSPSSRALLGERARGGRRGRANQPDDGLQRRPAGIGAISQDEPLEHGPLARKVLARPSETATCALRLAQLAKVERDLSVVAARVDLPAHRKCLVQETRRFGGRRKVGELRENSRNVDVRHALTVGTPVQCERVLQVSEGGRAVAAPLGDACELLQCGRAATEADTALVLKRERFAQEPLGLLESRRPRRECGDS